MALTAAISVVAVASGNNLLYLMSSALLVLWTVEFVLGAWNVRGVDAQRLLPAELVADSDAVGRIVVRNPREWMSAFAVRVRDVGTGTEVHVGVVATGGSTDASARWRFTRRGQARLVALEVVSLFPFGWLEHHVKLPRVADVVVFPRPSSAVTHQMAGDDAGRGRRSDTTRGGLGDFAGLRPYQSGDRLHSVHWRTTARAGEIMVVERSSEAEPAIRVVLREGPPDAWEGEISRAAGAVGRGIRSGLRVGLDIPATQGRTAKRFPARGGAAWRRSLLEALARLPEAQ